MFSKGNQKIGDEVWGFALPSARRSTCPGSTPACRRECYDKRLEKVRPAMLRRRRENLRLTKMPEFVPTAVALIKARGIRRLRWQVGGDVYSADYARKLLEVMRATRGTRHWLYTRSWRVSEIRPLLEEMAGLRNVRVWYSLDRDTGVPASVAPGVRLCYLQTGHGDLPPEGVTLVFRPQRLRRREAKFAGGALVCPTEQGVRRQVRITCQSCGVCSGESEAPRPGAVALTLVS